VHGGTGAGTLSNSADISSVYFNSRNLNSKTDEVQSVSPYGAISFGTSVSPAEESQMNEMWREQVASRVQQHRAKRKNSDPGPNMELRFPVQEAPVDARVLRARRFVAQAATRSPFHDPEPSFRSADSLSTEREPEDVPVNASPNLIRFPLSGAGQSASRNALATVHDYHAAMMELEAETPAHDSLRITDAQPEEQAMAGGEMQPPTIGGERSPSGTHPTIAYLPEDDPPIVYRAAKQPPAEQLELPNFDDIQLEATHHQVMTDLELAPQPAALGQRMMAGIVDAVIVMAAAAVFNVTFTQLAEENPHSRMALLCAVAVGGVLWTLYQYTFLVHGHGTPGMHLAQLELARFDGKPVSGFDRRCRAVASALSGLSLGLGFLWALVDEDQLGWHDRMTKTLIRSSVPHSAVSRETVW
jgi:uncharacterized RDD family membrane protein YckC